MLNPTPIVPNKILSPPFSLEVHFVEGPIKSPPVRYPVSHYEETRPRLIMAFIYMSYQQSCQ